MRQLKAFRDPAKHIEKVGEKPRFVLVMLWSCFGLALLMFCSNKRKPKGNQSKTKRKQEQDQSKRGERQQ